MEQYTTLRRERRFIKITGGLLIFMTKCIAGIVIVSLFAVITLAAALPCLPLVIYRLLKPIPTTKKQAL